MTNLEIKEKIEPYLKQEDMTFVQAYLDAKEGYLKNPSPDNSAAMHYAFQNVFFVIKQPMVCGEISRQQFDHFIELIQEGL